jgi:hypothetical protein
MLLKFILTGLFILEAAQPEYFVLFAKNIFKSDLFQQDVTLTVDENLNKLKGSVLAPKKLAAANRSLKRLKDSLPK